MKMNSSELFDHLDDFYKLHSTLKQKYNSSDIGKVLAGNDCIELNAIIHEQAKKIHDLIDYRPDELPEDVARKFRSHPFHRDFILQSKFVRHALDKPYGYAGDKDLMLMICDEEYSSTDNYSSLSNKAYLSVPGTQAVRDRIKALTALIGSLQKDSKILNLACGPALEIAANAETLASRDIEVLLLDHDINTIRYLSRQPLGSTVRYALGDALAFIKGRSRVAAPKPNYLAVANPAVDFRGIRSLFSPLRYTITKLEENYYDFVYTAGLYDYIREFKNEPAKGASGLTKFLFDRLKVGGNLLIGNFLTQNENNPHQSYLRMVMELYSDWRLIYRTPEQIAGFCSILPAGRYSYKLLNEKLEESDLLNDVIGFISIRKH
jgi:hypothetical protein